MKIVVKPVGSYQTNCYIIKDDTSGEIVIIDPGNSSDLLIKEIEKLQGNVKYILLTHAHADHTGAVQDLTQHFKIPVYINKKDEDLTNKGYFMLDKFNQKAKADGYINDGDLFNIGDFKIKAIETPGHTPGGICFLVNENLFSGDTLFEQSVGRTDLEGGDSDNLVYSIKNKLFTLPDEIIVFPGHGPKTSIKNEKKYNPFL